MSKKQSDLEVLLASREVPIAGVTITVREYSLSDAMQLYSEIDAFASCLSGLFAKDDTIKMGDIDPIIASNYKMIQKLVARSVGQSELWLDSLSASDGQILLDYWWSVNASFFINAAMRKLIQDENNKAKPLTGEKSLPLSSSTGIAQSSLSTTPKDSSNSTTEKPSNSPTESEPTE